MNKVWYLILTLITLFNVVPVMADDAIMIDLRDPEYQDNVLSTTGGGIISAPGIRIQARKLSYCKVDAEGNEQGAIVAEGDVRFEMGDYLLVGQKLEYSLVHKTGFLYEGRSAVFPWFFGGSMIQICADGSYLIYDGYITTSESLCKEWQVHIDVARLYPNHDLIARDISFKVGSIPIFWLPRLCLNLDTICDSPVKYTINFGGRQGSRIGMIYEIFSLGNLNTFLRVDYNFKRGLGGGIESHYRNLECMEKWDSINYFARDCSSINTHIHTRYRFQGHYLKCWRQGKTVFDLSYDKMSDKDMATDYADQGLDIKYARKSDLLLHHREDYWLANIEICPRLNSFQTINQELPTISFATMPISLTESGLITGFHGRASYLDYQYAHGSIGLPASTTTRVELQSYAYQSFGSAAFKVTPTFSGVGIIYGNSTRNGGNWQGVGTARIDCQSLLWKQYDCCKHVVRPYLTYEMITHPVIDPNRLFIFDITDAWYRVQTVRTGVQQNMITSSCIPVFRLDTYIWAFIDNHHVAAPIPKGTINFSFNYARRLHSALLFTLDMAHGGIGELNYMSGWTVNDDFAIQFEYRQRNKYQWRKVDYENFVLDFFQSQQLLLNPISELSDRRKTLLLHFYYRLAYDYALEWESRLGWDRMHEPLYFEYTANLHTTLYSHWKVKLAYQHRKGDDRLAIYFSLGLSKPKEFYMPSVDCTDCALWY